MTKLVAVRRGRAILDWQPDKHSHSERQRRRQRSMWARELAWWRQADVYGRAGRALFYVAIVMAGLLAGFVVTVLLAFGLAT